MQIISMTGEYALIAMLYLSIQEEGVKDRKVIVTVEEISRATGIPVNFLSKIMVNLGKSNLVRSSRGCKGGCSLARPSDKISALEVIEAVEGPLRLNQCSVNPNGCPATSWCPTYSMWAEAQEFIVKLFSKYTLHSMAMGIKGQPSEPSYFKALLRRFGENKIQAR